MTQRILVADDEAAWREILSEVLRDAGYTVEAVADGALAIEALGRGGFHAVVSDVRMPRADGLAVLEAAGRLPSPPPVVLLTAFASIEQAVEAMRRGAFDYLRKPLSHPAALRAVVARALEERPRPPSDAPDDGALFSDPASLRLLEVVRLVAARDTTVLLEGESGVGKEVLARRLHRGSGRRDGPLVPVNCGAIPADLFESQLFGHAAGAFTGASRAHAGFFEAASGGTLLLDEVGELPAAAQVKLLRALEERRVTRVGETRERAVDVRLIAATNRDLRQEARAGRFREDLYYRVSVFPIRVPPLRERPGDVLPLAERFCEQAGGRGLSAAARRALSAHLWPGNVRELRNVIERAAILAGGGTVEAEHLELEAPRAHARAGAGAREDDASLKDLERQAILEALDACGGNRRKAAERLGIALRTLQYKLKAYGVTRA